MTDNPEPLKEDKPEGSENKRVNHVGGKILDWALREAEKEIENEKHLTDTNVGNIGEA